MTLKELKNRIKFLEYGIRVLKTGFTSKTNKDIEILESELRAARITIFNLSLQQRFNKRS